MVNEYHTSKIAPYWNVLMRHAWSAKILKDGRQLARMLWSTKHMIVRDAETGRGMFNVFGYLSAALILDVF